MYTLLPGFYLLHSIHCLFMFMYVVLDLHKRNSSENNFYVSYLDPTKQIYNCVKDLVFSSMYLRRNSKQGMCMSKGQNSTENFSTGPKFELDLRYLINHLNTAFKLKMSICGGDDGRKLEIIRIFLKS